MTWIANLVGYRTIIVNALSLAVLVFGRDVIPLTEADVDAIMTAVEGAAPYVITLVNIAMRFLTKSPVGKKPG